LGIPIARGETSDQQRDHPLLRHWLFAPLRWAIRLWQAINTRTVDLKEAEAHIDELIDEAEHGKPFTISVDGKPMVKVKHMEKSEIDSLPKPEAAAAPDKPLSK
jgi:prevent-host-death family protein